MGEEPKSQKSDHMTFEQPLSIPSSLLSALPPSNSILKRPKTTSSSSIRQKSAVSFASSVLNNIDSDTEQSLEPKRPRKFKDYIRQLPIYLAKSILCMLDEKSLEKCKLVSTYWKKMAMEVEDEATMTKMLYDDMMLLQVNISKIFYYKISH
jgi:hypothetical protein